MKISLITPTHDFKYLNDLYDSIVEQTYSNWEWILYINGKGIHQKIPSIISNDPRVKVIVDKSNNHNIGYLKNRAFHAGTGDVLVEMDHDDLLVNTCLEKVALVFGNEHSGVSQEALELSDGNILIPQVGMIQSLNISVACAVTLFEAYRQRMKNGMYDAARFNEDEFHLLMDDWSKR